MDGLIIDCFAGGGGASKGIEMALNRHVDIAVNHDPEAIRKMQLFQAETELSGVNRQREELEETIRSLREGKFKLLEEIFCVGLLISVIKCKGSFCERI